MEKMESQFSLDQLLPHHSSKYQIAIEQKKSLNKRRVRRVVEKR
jgi:hypothetical protein